jgi:hypothetical protein
VKNCGSTNGNHQLLCTNYSVADIMSVSDVMGDYSIGVLSIPEIEQYGI